MAGYRQIYSTFWDGATGRQIRKLIESGSHGFELWAVYNYLITNKHANWLGIYSLPMPYLYFDLGSSSEGASEGLQKALRRLCDMGFCAYDEETEVVWVLEMARIQLGESLSSKDNRTKAVQRDFLALPKCPFLHSFWEKYGVAFHLPRPFGSSPSEGACGDPLEPLGSQEQDQEQDQDLKTPTSPEVAAGDSADPSDLSGQVDLEGEEPAGEKIACSNPSVDAAETLPAVATETLPTTSNCPHDQIIALYHEILPSLPRVRSWSEPNRKALRARWREDNERQSLDWWRSFFEQVQASDFLTGRSKDWAASLGWLVGPKNFDKVLNGQYENREAVSGGVKAEDPMAILKAWAQDDWLKMIVARGLAQLLADRRRGAPRGEQIAYTAGLYEQTLRRKQIALSPEVDGPRLEVGFKALMASTTGWPEYKDFERMIPRRPAQERIERHVSDDYRTQQAQKASEIFQKLQNSPVNAVQ